MNQTTSNGSKVYSVFLYDREVASGSDHACIAAARLLTGECELGLAAWHHLCDLRLQLEIEVAAVLKASNMELG